MTKIVKVGEGRAMKIRGVLNKFNKFITIVFVKIDSGDLIVHFLI